ncbi:hypothetical protein jhhlp_001845 [Lomentospora prolificans]|uniref:Uncharacterized protein n=1 Tax=Lomentospora prolificans TaxID=41688 RepID=A0A2N3NCC9_9PEZI|nr:hypothetical protein jhhlp_001845 [Lomentospora prolificans]
MEPSPETAWINTRKELQSCRFADTNQWHLFDNISYPTQEAFFVEADGSTINQAEVDISFSPREGFTGYFREANNAIQAVHLVSPGDLEQIGPDEVKAAWA